MKFGVERKGNKKRNEESMEKRGSLVIRTVDATQDCNLNPPKVGVDIGDPKVHDGREITI